MVDDDWVIKVENVGKKFTRSLKKSMVYGLKDVTKSILGLPVHEDALRDSEFWAIKDVSFELKRGESLGLIGRNGSGKSTLLRLINGIYPPSAGSITIKGRMGALIAVGSGFHPHMTGYENIFLNATILGMSRAEIEEKLDEIIAFAEIGEFIDAPVSTYSSGMTVRLGFAIAVHADIDILLADEVLAVGDASFRKKSFDKIAELQRHGVSIIFVSHDPMAVQRVCETAILFHHLVKPVKGRVYEIITEYERLLDSERVIRKDDVTEFVKGDVIEVKEIALKPSTSMYDFSECLEFTVRYKVLTTVNNMILSFDVRKNKFLVARAWDVDVQQELLHERERGEYKNYVSIPMKYFTCGYYSITLNIGREGAGYIQTYPDVILFSVHDKKLQYFKHSRTRDDAATNLPIVIKQERVSGIIK